MKQTANRTSRRQKAINQITPSKGYQSNHPIIEYQISK